MRKLIFYDGGLREFLQFRFQPSVDLLVVLASFLVLHISNSIAWQIVTQAHPIPFFLLSGPVSMFAAGIAIPVAYNSLVKKRPLSEMGISKKHWKKSLALSFVLLFLQALPLLLSPIATPAAIRIRALIPPFRELLPLIPFEIMSALFFVVFFQGRIQMRL